MVTQTALSWPIPKEFMTVISFFYVMARDRLARGKKIEGVVGTLMTNYAIEKKFGELGLNFFRAKVGDRYVLLS